MKLKDQIAIHEQREETARKNHTGSIIMAISAFAILTVVYFGTRGGVNEMEARDVARRQNCTYISNHVSNDQKVVVMNCSGAIIHKAYE